MRSFLLYQLTAYPFADAGLHTQQRHDPVFGPYPWLVSSTAMVNHYYVYIVDEDFGPLFLKFCSYFPHNAKLCVNGHEYLKRQLAKRGVAFDALDNGVPGCADPALMRRLADGLTAPRIDALLRKCLARLPHPYTVADRRAGIRYDVSILQAEFALTQVFDRPVQGRVFFEEVMRENLDLGRPDHVQFIFDRRVTKRTPSRYRTRVGVVPSLQLDYKHSRIKQYHKEGRVFSDNQDEKAHVARLGREGVARASQARGAGPTAPRGDRGDLAKVVRLFRDGTRCQADT